MNLKALQCDDARGKAYRHVAWGLQRGAAHGNAMEREREECGMHGHATEPARATSQEDPAGHTPLSRAPRDRG